MAYRNIDKNDPRYDPSSLIVSMENEEIECESAAYGDNVTVGEARALGTSLPVGDTAGQYKADELEITMHEDAHQRLLERLKSLAGGLPVSRRRVTITASYSEIDPRNGSGMPQKTDTIEGARYIGTKKSASQGSDPLKVTARFYVHRVRWHGEIYLA